MRLQFPKTNFNILFRLQWMTFSAKIVIHFYHSTIRWSINWQTYTKMNFTPCKTWFSKSLTIPVYPPIQVCMQESHVNIYQAIYEHTMCWMQCFSFSFWCLSFTGLFLYTAGGLQKSWFVAKMLSYNVIIYNWNQVLLTVELKIKTEMNWNEFCLTVTLSFPSC